MAHPSPCKSIAEQCSSALTGAKRLQRPQPGREREKKKKDREIRTSSSKRTGAFCTKLYYYTRVYIILGKAALESCTNSLLQGASDFSRPTLWQNLKIYSMLNGSGAVHVIAYIVNMNKIIDGAVTHDFNIFTCIISINSIKMVYY